MKKNLFRIVCLAVTLVVMLGLVACDLSNLPFDIPGLTGGNSTGDNTDNGNNDGGNSDGGNTDGGNTDTDPTKLALIENNKANFRVVYTSGSGSTVVKSAMELVKTLRRLGVEVEDAIADDNPALVTDCEIIIGTNARNRDSKYVISDKYLGEKGYVVKIVDNRVLIAGGVDSLTKDALDNFIKKQMGITNKTTELPSLSVARDYVMQKLTEYSVTSIKVAGIDLSEYTLVIDVEGMGNNDVSKIETFRNDLYKNSGYWLDLGTVDAMADYAHRFIIRYTSDAGDKGFRAKVLDNGDFVIECAYANVFNTTFEKFVTANILNKIGSVSFGSTFEKKETVNVVYYSDFGAKGDGETDDFLFILAAHQFANQGGQKVMGDEGATYYIAENFNQTINVLTDVDFNGATFLINDTGSIAYANRNHALFTLARESGAYVAYNETQIDARFGRDITISFGDTSIPWLADELTETSLVRVENKYHKDFIRHGANQNSGANRLDMFIVDADGNISPDTPVAFDFDEFTTLNIYSVNDKPITVTNGKFINICCRCVVETYNETTGRIEAKYHSYKRGFAIYRTNATISNITHRMQDEPDLDYLTGSFGQYGDCNESYPYYGFFFMDNTYNFTAKDCDLTGHTTYYEDKPATTSTGGVKPNPVPMGSYDYVAERSISVTFENVTQYVSSGYGLADSRYWGIMSSNGSKNMTFRNCEVNRFDAHRGFWNATLENTIIGHTINIVGGGTLNLIGVTKLTGPNFMALRGDYGAYFRGDMNIIDCHHECRGAFNSNHGNNGLDDQGRVKYAPTTTIINSGFTTSMAEGTSANTGSYWYWDFGYTTYMPENVVIDNFTSNAGYDYNTKTANGSIYIFNDLPNIIFGAPNPETGEPITNIYQITKSVKLLNMSEKNQMHSRIKLCSKDNENFSMINAIPVERTYKDE